MTICDRLPNFRVMKRIYITPECLSLPVGSGIIVLLSILITLLSAESAHSQGAHIHVAEESTGFAIAQLQLRGYMLSLNPTDLPYSDAVIVAAITEVDRNLLSPTELRWLNLVQATVSDMHSEEGAAVIGIRVEGGLKASNNERLDVLRYLDSDETGLWPHVKIQPRFSVGGFAAAIGGRHDVYYDKDPDGIDSALRLFMRAEDAYVRYESRWFSASIARIQRHWGQYGEESTIVSSNPRSYDQIGFTLGHGRLRLRSTLGELDSITGDNEYTGLAGEDPSGSKRRYLAASRLDWRPNQNLTVTAFQSVLYSGENSNLSLKFLNPLLPVVLSLNNTPKNDENNGFLGFAVWHRFKKTAFYIQTTLDDFDIINLNEPSSFAVTGSVSFMDVIARSTLQVGGTVVSARTYNTHQVEGQYVYLLRGIATQFSDYISGYARIEIFSDALIPGLTVSPGVYLLLQGQADIRTVPFPSEDETGTILSGTVESTVRPSVRIRYDPSPLFFFSTDLGINFTTNDEHIANTYATRFVGLAQFGLKIALDGHMPLSF